MKKFNIIAISILAFCTFGILAFAKDYEKGYNLAEGQSQEGIPISLQKGDAAIYLINETPNVNATIGATISKKNWLGNYSTYDRYAVKIQGKRDWIIPYTVDKATYKPTIVHNTTGHGQRISGYFYLAN